MTFADAVERLVQSGLTVELADFPGLLVVNGQELTMMQVISRAQQMQEHRDD